MKLLLKSSVLAFVLCLSSFLACPYTGNLVATPTPTAPPTAPPAAAQLLLDEYQGLETSGAADLEYFSIGNAHFVAVANYTNGSTYVLDSKIYKWNGHTFNLHQLITGTQHAFDFEFFTIDNAYYLMVANLYNNITGTYALKSPLYKWNPATQLFESYTTQPAIDTWGAADFEFFTMEGQYYLAVANYRSDNSYNTNSYVYQWKNNQFDTAHPVATIATKGALDWQHFIIGSVHYLAAANYYSETSGEGHIINSRLYKWNSITVQFELAQEIVTIGAYDWEYFMIGDDHYLTVANYTNGNAGNINSGIYKWNPLTEKFDPFQSIVTNNATSWKHFVLNEQHYLTVANYAANSSVYRWDGGKFAEDATVLTRGAYDWEFFTIGTENFLAVANCYGSTDGYNQLSSIYKVSN